MKYPILKSSLALFVAFLIVACSSTTSKMNDFIKSYNQYAGKMSNAMIKSTEAKKKSEREIEIIFHTQETSDGGEDFYKTALSSMIPAVFTSDESSKDLINEGVTFKLSFVDPDGTVLSNALVDKAKLDEIMKTLQKDGKSTDINDSKNGLESMLTLLRKNLPMVIDESGIKIVDIQVSDKNELVYIAEVPQDLSENLKSAAAKELVRQEMLRGTKLKSVFESMKSFNVQKIKYIYKDTKGKEIMDLLFTPEDCK